MFYKQSVNSVKMVILCLDGGILDLNRLRYNYFNRICKQYDQSISKQDFTMSLGNYKTMYTNSFIDTAINNDAINERIEKDLYEYAKLKQNIKKDGIDELLQFFRQKKIKVAVISTHKTKRAIQYLQLTQIYQYIDFVIGGDSDNSPLPSPSILQTVCRQMDIKVEDTLVIANFPTLVSAANEVFMNIVYIRDLVDADSNITASVYKTVKNNLEMINVFLFAKYDTVEMYSPILGMSKNMDLMTLEKTYQKLLVEYQSDPTLIALVKRTYRYFLMEINDTNIRNKKDVSFSTTLTTKNKEIEEVFENKIEENITKEVEENKSPEVSIEPESNIDDGDSKMDTIIVEDTVKFASENKVTIENTMPLSFGKEAESINSLMNKINGVDETKNKKESKKEKEIESSIEDIETKGVIDVILDFIYVTVLFFIATFVALLIYMVVEDFIQSSGMIPNTIQTVINTYIDFVRMCYTYLFDGLHTLIAFVPSYKELIQSNNVLSTLAIEIILFTIFNITIFYILKGMYCLIRKGLKKDDY